jgi:hypothetical protein
MDDLMAAKLCSGPNLIQIGEQLRFAIQLVDDFPLRDPVSTGIC